jgi:hypothetical protein
MAERFRVQSYCNYDSRGEWCVCDFAREGETGLSPIVVDKQFQRTFPDRADAEAIARWLNTHFAADPLDTTFAAVLQEARS